MAVNAAANRALAPEGSKLLELEVIHMGCCQTTNEYCQTATPQNSPQSMRVLPGLRLIGAGGKIHAAEEPGAAAGHPAEPRSYLRQLPGATLHNRVRLDLESCHLTLRHLYVGASRATSSELLEA